jgi:hypothetical protein
MTFIYPVLLLVSLTEVVGILMGYVCLGPTLSDHSVVHL